MNLDPVKDVIYVRWTQRNGDEKKTLSMELQGVSMPCNGENFETYCCVHKKTTKQYGIPMNGYEMINGGKGVPRITRNKILTISTISVFNSVLIHVQ